MVHSAVAHVCVKKILLDRILYRSCKRPCETHNSTSNGSSVRRALANVTGQMEVHTGFTRSRVDHQFDRNFDYRSYTGSSWSFRSPTPKACFQIIQCGPRYPLQSLITEQIIRRVRFIAWQSQYGKQRCCQIRPTAMVQYTREFRREKINEKINEQALDI
jgi:hypothetical protein